MDDHEGPLRPRMCDCKMITIKLLDSRGDKIERNLKPLEEEKIEKVKLFKDHDDWSIKIEKNLPSHFKQKLIKLLQK